MTRPALHEVPATGNRVAGEPIVSVAAKADAAVAIEGDAVRPVVAIGPIVGLEDEDFVIALPPVKLRSGIVGAQAVPAFKAIDPCRFVVSVDSQIVSAGRAGDNSRLCSKAFAKKCSVFGA
ncbi:hypothetical protein [Mesobacterium pallidum]|uniref:hypothetical protein n=1 Tax=Mesobacterium pallidum TaxID=2872037 RepID=UPI001EE2D246|nr:hypothetical protein [Mesobacterium pallidum]